MPTLSQLAQILITCKVTTAEGWQRAAKLGGEDFEPWDAPSGAEAMARALALAGDTAGALEWKAKAEALVTTIPGAYQQIRQLGKVTGHTAQAESVIRRMKREIAQIVAKRKQAATGSSVYHELDPTFYSATSKSFVMPIDRCGSGRPVRARKSSRSWRSSVNVGRQRSGSSS